VALLSPFSPSYQATAFEWEAPIALVRPAPNTKRWTYLFFIKNQGDSVWGIHGWVCMVAHTQKPDHLGYYRSIRLSWRGL